MNHMMDYTELRKLLIKILSQSTELLMVQELMFLRLVLVVLSQVMSLYHILRLKLNHLRLMVMLG